MQRNVLSLQNCLGLARVDRKCYVRGEDINPETGKPYAVNPASGAWDDNYFAQNFGGGGTGTNIPPFKFDYATAEAEAFKELEPYYKQKLIEADGDVELAKKRIKEDYDLGLRQNKEDLAYQQGVDRQTAEEETETEVDSLNRRGVLFSEGAPGDTAQKKMSYSGLGQKQMGTLANKQEARRMAIQRAIERSNESLGIEKERGLEDTEIADTRYRRDLEQEKVDKARFSLVPYKREKAYTQYQASVNPYMQGDQGI